MKLPAALGGLASLDKEKALRMLLAYGDKAVLGLLGIVAAIIAWGGIDAIRLKSASYQRLPKAILDSANRATSHIDRLPTPPRNVRPKVIPLAERLKPWQAPEIAPAAAPMFDRPLFQELAKRTKPAVFPIEQLTATAGVAVLALPDGGGEKGNPAEGKPAVEQGNPGGQRRGAGRRGDADPFGGFGQPPPAGPTGGLGQPQQGGPPTGRIVPFVVVTGLVPFAKQREEYERRFSQANYRDEKRDQPIWAEYLVERAMVEPGGGEAAWQRIDLQAVVQKARREWAGEQKESLPAGLLMPMQLGRDGVPAPSFAGYCLPLPRLAVGSWGADTMHPQMVLALREAWSVRRPPNPQQASEPDVGPTVDFPQRLFRFIDTTVEPGRSYRYRVRLSVWNPNWKLEPRYVDAAGAGQEKLASAPSDPSPAVTVPDPIDVLVRGLSRAETKRFKQGVLEALVIGPSEATGIYALRSVVTEVGGLVNVDAGLNKPGDTRSRGEDIRTDRVIVDVRGRQTSRPEERATGRAPLPPEPFELLVLKPDGSFEVASVADSQLRIEANAATLPVIESTTKEPAGDRGAPGGGPASPF